MTEFPLVPEVPMERVLLHELIHRINNVFSALIGAATWRCDRPRARPHGFRPSVRVSVV